MKNRIIISTGQGRLHLIESAKAIKNAGFEVKVITGWIPAKIVPDSIINFLGEISGNKNLLYGLRKREPKELNRKSLYSHSFSEFVYQLLLISARFGLLSKDWAVKVGWQIFGISSKKDIKEAEVFHVRSGAGNSGAISRAKEHGMFVVVDHSAAHPKEIHKQLSKIYRSEEIPIHPDMGLWKLVMDDCKEADVLLVNSDYVKSTFLKHGFCDEKISVVPLGIRRDFLYLKKNYTIDGKLKLLYTGSVRKWKGVHLLIEVAKQLFSNGILFEFNFVGSISNEIEIPEELQNLNLLRFHGHVAQDALKSYLKDADIYVFPSYCEGAAQSLKEAMSAGLPVIATNESGAPIKNGENGIIVKDNCVKSIYDAVISLSHDESFRREIGKNAAETIKKGHSWDNYGESVVSLYRKYLGYEV
ncbi:glycosyltransferase family 4 protein [Flavicella marina]|uniref:glycosyltransferase family 4 protein n=1 Tax=Flavicella marina TaxID=1475951 RepID=UPI0012641CC1|nr:glycosyltransferase family 4 protein [Flavicella marina]